MAVIATAVLLFGACGGDDSGKSSTSTPPITTSGTAPPITSATFTPAPTLGDVLYVVQDGDTLGAIADNFGVTIEAIMTANGLVDETALSIGQTLTIPGVLPNPDGTPYPTPPQVDFTGESPIGIHLQMPIAGACIPTNDDQMPNSPREYRAGVHEGVDFFTGFACTDVVRGTPITAVADGVVIRADRDYRPITGQELDEVLAQSAAQGFTDEGTLDKLRGRQLWIDHGDGIVTRYSHTDSIAAGVFVGSRVIAGQEVAYVGDSGTPESVSNPDFNLHLHFEVRVDDSYLGAGLSLAETRALYYRAFGVVLQP